MAGWPRDVQPAGQPELDQLIPLVYHELRAIAHRELLHDQRDRTLSTTELVHEAYLRLSQDPRVTTRGRGYFFAAASQAMRRIVVDCARRKRRLKRGGGLRLVTLDDAPDSRDGAGIDVLDLEQGLGELAAIAPRAAQVVECRFYGGLDVEQTALAVSVTTRTVHRDWAFARAWLFDYLQRHPPDGKS
ncbi:MAG TPA: ECF-type sigma factor [Gemmatimonadales bacterium]